MTVQKRNGENIDLLSADFVRRSEASYVQGNIVSHLLMLPGLRAAWPITSTDENGLVYDISGQGRRLTPSGATAFGMKSLLSYLVYGGANYLYRADEVGLDITGPLTFGGWFYQTALTSRGFIGKFGAAGARSYYLVNAATADYRLIVSSDGTALTNAVSTVAPVTGAWLCIIGRYVPSTDLTIFVNGTFDTNAVGVPAALFNSATQFRIGMRGDGGEPLVGYGAAAFLCNAPHEDVMIRNFYEQTKHGFGY